MINRTMMGQIESDTVTSTKKVLSAILFFGSTILLVVVTKVIIGLRYVYPPYQVFGLSQLVIVAIILWIGRCVNLLQFPCLDRRIARRLYPLLLLNIGCMAANPDNFGIMSSSMFNMSRRLVLLITITTVLERVILEIQMSSLVKLTIVAMMVGAMIGGTDSDNVSIADYFIILFNYSFSGATRVYFKKILDSRELGASGLMYYSTIIILIPNVILAYVFDALNFSNLSIYWDNLDFLSHLLLTSVMGAMLSCSSIICIQYNGALTTTIIGSLVNTLITVITYWESLNDNEDDEGEPIKFSWHYCVGWSIIVLASLVYICVTFKPYSASNNALINKV